MSILPGSTYSERKIKRSFNISDKISPYKRDTCPVPCALLKQASSRPIHVMGKDGPVPCALLKQASARPIHVKKKSSNSQLYHDIKERVALNSSTKHTVAKYVNTVNYTQQKQE